MILLDPRLDQLGHITMLIKTYRQLRTIPQADGPRSLENYLRQHLSISEYILWRSLHGLPRETDGVPPIY